MYPTPDNDANGSRSNQYTPQVGGGGGGGGSDVGHIRHENKTNDDLTSSTSRSSGSRHRVSITAASDGEN
ncbi:hypothetical protein TSAR_013910 [Trichomalopsis sarcophagae]|uniref:Uncharacterized protein n=1 Tax=Trichomalopsis sarcophagae TaxID=543379 RepID=A0A232FKL3_9HYME|nr:hypothetical protein TSAR_013910 [Trichomalopsis sarcophagae]